MQEVLNEIDWEQRNIETIPVQEVRNIIYTFNPFNIWAKLHLAIQIKSNMHSKTTIFWYWVYQMFERRDSSIR